MLVSSPVDFDAILPKCYRFLTHLHHFQVQILSDHLQAPSSNPVNYHREYFSPFRQLYIFFLIPQDSWWSSSPLQIQWWSKRSFWNHSMSAWNNVKFQLSTSCKVFLLRRFHRSKITAQITSNLSRNGRKRKFDHPLIYIFQACSHAPWFSDDEWTEIRQVEKPTERELAIRSPNVTTRGLIEKYLDPPRRSFWRLTRVHSDDREIKKV